MMHKMSILRKALDRRNIRPGNARSRSRGSVVLGVLAFILVTSMLLFGIGTFAVGHQTRAKVDSDWAKALDLAEAGINYEFRKLSQSAATADQFPGKTVTLGTGSFKVYCTNKNDTTPWTVGDYLYVISTGTVNGVSRTIKASSKSRLIMGDFAIYTMGGTSYFKSDSMFVNGDIGTNAKLQFTAPPNLSGDVYLYGTGAQLIGGTGYSTITAPTALSWPTVDQIANATVAGGMATIATVNNNANAVPPIVGNSITQTVTLSAGNYYVTKIDLIGANKILFDNTNGPVNLWVGPVAGVSTCRFRGGESTIPISSDPSKACRIYVATASTFKFEGPTRVDALVYAYNKYANGTAYGSITFIGRPDIYGSVMGNIITVNQYVGYHPGPVNVNYVGDLISPTAYPKYYGYDNSWVEVNPR